MNSMRLILVIASCLTLLACPAVADVANGDFASGGTDWTTTVPADWIIDFPATGGNPNGNASILSIYFDSAGEGCVSQVFTCGETGEEGTCIITFDATMRWLDSNEFAGRLKVYVNGFLLWTAPDVNEMDWTTVEVPTECGTVNLDLCLEVDSGNNMWQGNYDNVGATCTGGVADEKHTWGALKSTYR